MTSRQLRDQGELFALDEDLLRSHLNSKRITRLLNATLETEVDRRKALVQALFGAAGEDAYIEPPFYCDYGENIRVGKRFYCNYDCVFLDVGKITLGDRVMLGPKVALYAAAHAIDSTVRATDTDIGMPITIGDDVWIGGSSVVCPGVTIGSNVVIGAGSVVTKDIPDNVVAAGNPCRVLRPITQADTAYWQEKLRISQQLLAADAGCE